MSSLKDNPCFPRRSFKTIESARAASAHIAASQGQHRLPVPCPKCYGWHLSKDPHAESRPDKHQPPKEAPMPAAQPAPFKTVSEQEAIDAGGRWVSYEDIKRLLLDLDIALNGPDGRATAPTLVDIVGQVEQIAREINSPILEYVRWTLR